MTNLPPTATLDAWSLAFYLDSLEVAPVDLVHPTRPIYSR